MVVTFSLIDYFSTGDFSFIARDLLIKFENKIIMKMNMLMIE